MNWVSPLIETGWTEARDVKYSTFHDRWVAVGDDATTSPIFYSDDPLAMDWIPATFQGPSLPFTQAWRVAVSPSTGLWVATGLNGNSLTLASSSDGKTWTVFATPNIVNAVGLVSWPGFFRHSRILIDGTIRFGSMVFSTLEDRTQDSILFL